MDILLSTAESLNKYDIFSMTMNFVREVPKKCMSATMTSGSVECMPKS